jgi:preprotein translocase subunit YajC
MWVAAAKNSSGRHWIIAGMGDSFRRFCRSQPILRAFTLAKFCGFLTLSGHFQIMHLNIFLAQAATTATTGPSQQPAWFSFAPMILLVVVFYFILIRPQQKRAKELAKLVSSIKAGDKVETASGIRGLVISVKDNTVTLKSIDAKIEITKASVTQILESSTSTEIKAS